MEMTKCSEGDPATENPDAAEGGPATENPGGDEGGPATDNPGRAEGGPAADNVGETVGEQKLKHTEKLRGGRGSDTLRESWEAKRGWGRTPGHHAGLPAAHRCLSIFLLSCEDSVSFLTQGGSLFSKQMGAF